MADDDHEQSNTYTLTFSSSDTEDVPIFEPCFHWSYLATHRGYLKAIQMVLSLFGLISFVATTSVSDTYSIWIVAVAISGLTLTGTLLASHLVGLDQEFPNFPWLETEFAISTILAVCNYASVCCIAAFASKKNALGIGAAAFFSFGTIGAYAVDAWLTYPAIIARKRIVENVRCTRDRKSIVDVIAV